MAEQIQPESSGTDFVEQLRYSYPLHFAVFENDLFSLEELLETDEKEKINTLDIHGRTPLMLATILGHTQCADLLLKHGADANAQNKEMWGISHEAVLLNNPEFLKNVLKIRDFQRAEKTLKILLELRESLKNSDDFYVEMNWEFTSWLPFVKNMTPSDTYKIYKSGNSIRIDTTLLDFENHSQSNRSKKSFIFRFPEDDRAEICFVDYGDHNAYVQSIDLKAEPIPEEFEPSIDLISEKLRTPVTTTYIDVDNIGFERSQPSKLLSWIGSTEKEEDVEGFTCRVFNASNVEIVTKTCVDHLTEEDKQANNNDQGNKTMSFLIGLFEKKKVNNTSREGSGSPSSQRDSNDVYGGLNAADYLSKPAANHPNIGKPRQEMIRSNSFNASLWLSDSFPLKLRDQIFPILDIMSVRNAKFSRLKSFVELQLPSGFPVRIRIPLFHMINAQITFKNVNDPDPADVDREATDSDGTPVFRLRESIFQIPETFEIQAMDTSLLFMSDRAEPFDGAVTSRQTHQQRYNAVDVDDDYVYLLERFMAEDTDSPESSSSAYQQQMQLAIQESFAMSKNNSQQQAANQQEASDIEVDADLSRALELSLLDEENRRKAVEEEDEELKRILELSMLEK